jgi:hypothetical protein
MTNDANLMTPGKAFVPVGFVMEQHKQGGEGSGNFGHEGRPGEVGGSGPGGVSFTPAKTRQDAESFAKSNLLDPDRVASMEKWNAQGERYKQYPIVSYRGVDVDTANRINAELLKQQEKGMPKLGTITASAVRSEPGMFAKISGDKLELNTISMGTKDKFEATMKDQSRFYGKEGREAVDFLKSKTTELSPRDQMFLKAADTRLKYSRELVGNDIESVIQHECMHNFSKGYHIKDDAERETFRKERDRATGLSLNSEYKYKISAYGGESFYKSDEHLAESYVAYNKGEYENIHPEMLSFFRKWTK